MMGLTHTHTPSASQTDEGSTDARPTVTSWSLVEFGEIQPKAVEI